MPPRFRSLLRDTWFMIPLVAAVSVLFGLMLHPLVGIVTPLVMAPVFVYFAFVRYDAEGHDAGR